MEYKLEEGLDAKEWKLCDPIADYCIKSTRRLVQPSLFSHNEVETASDDIRVVELFAGVGGFRIGLERASERYKTVWNNQWEPSTKRQDASMVYCHRFGDDGHSNEDISTVTIDEIPDCDMLVGGFPCQDYSVATTLQRSGGIMGKKGVLWWQIYRILTEYKRKPKYLFFENVDRLLKSPASQRGRDFAIILASLNDLGYIVEWRVINAAEYGMPQRRRRTYIVAYRQDTSIANKIHDPLHWILSEGTIAKAFPAGLNYADKVSEFEIKGSLEVVSSTFNIDGKDSPFDNAGIAIDRKVTTQKVEAKYAGPWLTLGQIVLDEQLVPEEYFISDKDLPKWTYLKGGKSEKRVNKSTGFEYHYSEGSMAFPDALDKPSRTIITGEGGQGPSRFKHVILTPSGRYRRLMPLELERLNMFPDNHTQGASDVRRAFLMGNALVTGVVERIGVALLNEVMT
ncbi:MAG TPA: DNA (cytosine-5-)-methyltransferase [Bacteroides sp.]|nr:DNA (cytosine-5-)-methyltransferase [Bacteroides sp.]